MNIIFLDIDGVLNSLAYFKSNNGIKHSDFNEISDFHLQKLAEIYHDCDAKIVLSSTWRTLDDEKDSSSCYEMWKYLVASLKKYDMYIFDKTPFIDNNRPLEIKTWIDNQINKDEIKFVSLDDDFGIDKYYKYGIADCLVRTKFFCNLIEEGGLQQEHVDIAIKILKGI